MPNSKDIAASCPDRSIGSIIDSSEFDMYSMSYKENAFVNTATFLYTVPSGRINDTIRIDSPYATTLVPDYTPGVRVVHDGSYNRDNYSIFITGKYFINNGSEIILSDALINITNRTSPFNDNLYAASSYASELTSGQYCNTVAYGTPNTNIPIIFDISGTSFKISKMIVASKLDNLKVDTDIPTSYPYLAMSNSGFSYDGIERYNNFYSDQDGYVKPYTPTTKYTIPLKMAACLGNYAFRVKNGQKPLYASDPLGAILFFTGVKINASLKNVGTNYSTLPYLSEDNLLSDYGSPDSHAINFQIVQLTRMAPIVTSYRYIAGSCVPTAMECLAHPTLRTFAVQAKYAISFSIKLFQLGNVYRLFWVMNYAIVKTPCAVHQFYTLRWMTTGSCTPFGVTTVLGATAAIALASVPISGNFYKSDEATYLTGSIVRASNSDSGFLDVVMGTEIVLDKTYETGKQLHLRLKYDNFGKLEKFNITIDALTDGTDDKSLYQARYTPSVT